MKITIAAIGSRGDIQPMLALALTLKKQQHNITFCAPPDFEDFIKSYNLSFHPLGLSMRAITEENAQLYGQKKVPMKRVSEIMLGQLKAQFATLPDLVKTADLLIGGGPIFGAASVAEKFQIPYLFVTFSPNFLPSADYPPSMSTPNQDLSPRRNKFIWKMGRFINNRLSRKSLNRLRAELGLPPIKDYNSYLFSPKIIVAADKEIAPVPKDVSVDYLQIPAFILDSNREQTLDKSIIDFLDKGEAPVYIGFGSMPLANPEETSKMLLRVADKLQIRMIIDKGWANLGDIQIPDNILIISGAPHDLLFPKTAAVIHHAGAGTLAVAARAGVPQISIPTGFDQFYWGKRIELTGLGPKPCPVFQLNADYLVNAIKQTLKNQTMQEKAKVFGAKLRSTNGTEELAAFLPQFVK